MSTDSAPKSDCEQLRPTALVSLFLFFSPSLSLSLSLAMPCRVERRGDDRSLAKPRIFGGDTAGFEGRSDLAVPEICGVVYLAPAQW
jgi:hypothetical protein